MKLGLCQVGERAAGRRPWWLRSQDMAGHDVPHSRLVQRAGASLTEMTDTHVPADQKLWVGHWREVVHCLGENDNVLSAAHRDTL